MEPDFDRVRELYAERPLPQVRLGPPREQGAVTTALRRLIAKEGGRTIKTHGGPLGSGEPDILGAVRGVPLAIETKRRGAAGPTARQAENLRRWDQAGALSFWTADPESAMDRIRAEIRSRGRQGGT